MNSDITLDKESSIGEDRDPVRVIMEVIVNENLSHEEKANLIRCARNKFKSRRRIAFIALSALILSITLLFVAAVSDGVAGTTILATIHESQALFAGMEGVLTVIIAAYFKPKSINCE